VVVYIQKTDIHEEVETMKMFLVLAVSTVIAAGMLPSLPAKIILIGFVILAALIEGRRRVSKNRKNKPKFLFEQ
jgi:hypothetical protein